MMQEADWHIQDVSRDTSGEAALMAHKKVSEGIELLSHRQKLVKLADSSEQGRKVVKEYEANPLGEDSDDEKKIYRAQMKAEGKTRGDFVGVILDHMGFRRQQLTQNLQQQHNRDVIKGCNNRDATRGTGGLGIAFDVEHGGIGAKSAWLSIQISRLILMQR